MSDAYNDGYRVGFNGGYWPECQFVGREADSWMRGYQDGRNAAASEATRSRAKCSDLADAIRARNQPGPSMAEDREMLELAAEAAGIAGKWDASANNGAGMFIKHDGYCWIPLTDDGDALRLAVKLEIQTGYSEFSGCGFASWDRGMNHLSVYGPDDPCAATRRAIVRAAAEIGRRMKEKANG